MKKILVLFTLFLVTTMFCFAAEKPRWVGLPINVYIPEHGYMSSWMTQAFEAWEEESNGLVRFNFVRSKGNANIEVEFVDFVSHCNSPNAVGCCETQTRGGQYYRAYVTIGTKEYVRDYSTGRRVIQERPKEHIYGVMLHEAGHSIGLGHSPNRNSIMFDTDLDTLQYLTRDDLDLLYKKYH